MYMQRNQIIYIPFPTKENKSNAAQIKLVDILQKKYYVSGKLVKFFDIFKMLKTKAIFLNWIEDKLDYKMKLKIHIYKLFGVKIIWVFHNKLPHDISMDAKRVTANMKWLSDKCDVIWLFSQNSIRYIPNKKKNEKKAVFIPHIIYDSHVRDNNLSIIRNKYGILESDFVFIIFGLIRPYKNIERGIEAFTKLGLSNAKLIIAGNPTDAKYTKQIKKLCHANNNIILDLHYVSNLLLDKLIGISDVVVLPYNDKSSMNSGVMIQAFSNAKTVISPDICMARDFAKEKFFYGYRHSLEFAMERAYKNGKKINKKMGEMAKCYVEQNHSEKIVSEQLYLLLE